MSFVRSSLLRRRRAQLTKKSRGQHFRPGVERLEERAMLAFDLSLTAGVGAPTSGVTSSLLAGTTTFTATASGASLNLGDVVNELLAGRNVVVDSGSAGAESGNITTDFAGGFGLGIATTSLTFKTGSGANLVGDISLPPVQFPLGGLGTLVVQANRNIDVTGTTVADSMSLTSATGAISTGAAGVLHANNLALTAVTGIGTQATPIVTAANNPVAINLEAQTSTGGIFVSNTSNLAIGGVSLALAGVRVTGATGDIVLTNTGNVSITQNGEIVKGPANVTVKTVTSGDILTGGDNDGPNDIAGAVHSTGGDTTLNAVGNVLIGNATGFGDVQGVNVELTAGGNITLDANSFVDAHGAGSVTATAGGNISLLQVFDFNTHFSSEGGAINLSTGVGGTFTADAGGGTNVRSTANGGNGDITIKADDMIINDLIDAGAGTVTLTTVSAAQPIDLGGLGVGPRLALDIAETDLITASKLIIGSATQTGGISITAPISNVNSGWDTLDLKTKGKLSLLSTLDSNNEDLTLLADHIDLNANPGVSAIVTGLGSLTLAPVTPGNLIDIDLGSTTDLSTTAVEISSAELANVTAAKLIIGNSSTGKITFTNQITQGAGWNDLALTAGKNIDTTTVAGVDVQVDTLALAASTGIGASGNSLKTKANAVGGTLLLSANNTTSGGIFVKNSGPLEITGTGITNTGGGGSIQTASPLDVLADISFAADFTLQAGDNAAAAGDDLTISANVTHTGGGTITLISGDNIIQTAGLILSLDGTVIMTADNDADAAGGGITQNGGALTTGSLSLVGFDAVSFSAGVNDVATLAGSANGDFSYRDTNGFDLDAVSTTNDLTSTTGNVTLDAGAAVTQAGVNGEVFATAATKGLELLGAGSFALTQAGNDVANLAGNVAGNISFRDTNGFVLDTVGATNDLTSTTGNVTLNAGAAVTQAGVNGEVFATAATKGLELFGAGSFALTQAGNDVANLAGNVTGNISFRDTGGFILDTVGATNDLTSTTGNVTLNAGAAVTQAGVNGEVFATAATKGLELLGAGSFALTQAGNNVAHLAGSVTGDISYRDTNGFILDTVGATDDLTSTTGNVTLNAGAAVTQAGVNGEVFATAATKGLELLGAGSFALTQAGNDVANLAGNVTGNISFRDTGGFILDTVGATNDLTSTAGNVTLNAGAAVTQAGVNGEVFATAATKGLELLGAGSFDLPQSNHVVNLAGNVTGSILYNDVGALIIGTVNTDGLTSGGGNLDVTSGDSQTVNKNVTTSGAGHIVLEASMTVANSGLGINADVNAGDGAIDLRGGHQIDVGNTRTVNTSGALVIETKDNSGSVLNILGTSGKIGGDAGVTLKTKDGIDQVTAQADRFKDNNDFTLELNGGNDKPTILVNAQLGLHSLTINGGTGNDAPLIKSATNALLRLNFVNNDGSGRFSQLAGLINGGRVVCLDDTENNKLDIPASLIITGAVGVQNDIIVAPIPDVDALTPGQLELKRIQCTLLLGQNSGNNITVNDLGRKLNGLLIVGGAGNDVIHGSEKNDLILGGGGVDQLFGGAGDDLLFPDAAFAANGTIVDAIANNEFIDGQAGIDAVVALGTNDTVKNCENIFGQNVQFDVLAWLTANFVADPNFVFNQAAVFDCLVFFKTQPISFVPAVIDVSLATIGVLPQPRANLNLGKSVGGSVGGDKIFKLDMDPLAGKLTIETQSSVSGAAHILLFNNNFECLAQSTIIAGGNGVDERLDVTGLAGGEQFFAVITGTNSQVTVIFQDDPIAPPQFAIQQNPFNRLDVNADGDFSISDLFDLVGVLRTDGAHQVTAQGSPSFGGEGEVARRTYFANVNGDNFVNASDAFALVAAYRAKLASPAPFGGEGEAAPFMGFTVETAAYFAPVVSLAVPTALANLSPAMPQSSGASVSGTAASADLVLVSSVDSASFLPAVDMNTGSQTTDTDVSLSPQLSQPAVPGVSSSLAVALPLAGQTADDLAVLDQVELASSSSAAWEADLGHDLFDELAREVSSRW